MIFESPACDAVIAAEKPSVVDGGPCETCAFRSGTEANQTEHTLLLAKLCVEAVTPFHCHEQPQLCRGFIAAVNLNGVPLTEDARRFQQAAAFAAEVLAEAIAEGVKAELLVATR